MADLSTLRDLQRRLREATGPDRELDADICVMLKYVEADSDGAQNIRDGAKDEGWQDDDILYELDGEPCSLRTPWLTSSADASRALVRHHFPNAYISTYEWPNYAELCFSLSRHELDKASGGGKAPTTPLAACLALVSALIAIEEGKWAR